MKNSIKNLLIFICMLIVFNANSLYAQPVDHTFTYQGQLLDGSTPANGPYYITIQGYTTLAGVETWGNPSPHSSVNVDQGIFTLENVDLGAGAFDGLDLYLEVSVSVDGNNYEILSPRQKLSAVPYANNIVNGNASEGQVYTFSGGKWQSALNNHFSGDFTDLTNIPVAVTSLDDLTDAIVLGGNLFVGQNSGINTVVTGITNSAFGSSALNSNISGRSNSAFGASTLSSNNGEFNAAFGAFH